MIGVTDAQGRAAAVARLDLTGSQSPEGVGRAVVALAGDPDLLSLTGRALEVTVSRNPVPHHAHHQHSTPVP